MPGLKTQLSDIPTVWLVDELKKRHAAAGDETKQSAPYQVERDSAACDQCGGGGTWTVYGPDEIGIGISYEARSDAEDMASLLSQVYAKGLDKALSL